MEKLNNFMNIMNNYINTADKTYIKRINKDKNGNITNKLFLKDVLYASLQNLNESSLACVANDLKIHCRNDVSKNSLIKKRNLESTSTHIRDLNDSLVAEIYKSSNNFISPNNFKIDRNKKSFIRNNGDDIDMSLYVNRSNKRFIAIDGDQINTNKKLVNKRTIKLSKNGLYGIGLINNMFDVLNKIPINYDLIESSEKDFNKKKFNERKGLLDNINKLNNNDIVIVDKGYYSDKVMKELNDNNNGYIFRMKDNCKLFKNMGFGKSKLIEHNGTCVQLFKYKIMGNMYCIMTSITENISIAEIKALYWLRWNVETDIKKRKYDIVTNNKLRSLTYNSFMTDLESVRFMSIISSFIEHTGVKSTPTNKKINTKNCISILYKCLLHCFLYKREQEKMNISINAIYSTITTVVKDRSYDRIRKSPSTKWNAYGNRYGNKKDG